MLFIVMILTVVMLRMYKAAAVSSAFMKVYAIPCHDRQRAGYRHKTRGDS